MVYLRKKVADKIWQAWQITDIVSIGRNSDDNDIVISDMKCSRHHAGVYLEGEKCIIEDYGSSFGTIVNGMQIFKKQILEDHDVVVIAGTCLEFHTKSLFPPLYTFDLRQTPIERMDFYQFLLAKSFQLAFPMGREVARQVDFLLQWKFSLLEIPPSEKTALVQIFRYLMAKELASSQSNIFFCRFQLDKDGLHVSLAEESKNRFGQVLTKFLDTAINQPESNIARTMKTFDEAEVDVVQRAVNIYKNSATMVEIHPSSHILQKLRERFPTKAQKNVDTLRSRLQENIQNTYTILEEIGSGGMGVVFKARHLRMAKYVAIKSILPAPGIVDNEDIQRRFRGEANILNILGHSRIPKILDINEIHGVIYIIMEFAPGVTLDTLIDKKALNLADIFQIAGQILEVLAYTHEKNVLHRDLKPQNIMVDCEDGNHSVYILDFGVAKHVADSNVLSCTTSVTQQGTSVGTVLYMSPEQLNNEEIDARSDIYSIGVILYKMLCGELPIDGKDAQGKAKGLAVVSDILCKEPVSLLTRNLPFTIPRELDELVMSALAKDINKRPMSTQMMREKLREIEKSCLKFST